ncbi:hypothetical protein POTOM_024871 [Populus tomentosa]|uniref:Protein POLYCHOME n=1 Tax=Populus tomentosa TaxID=118781 RepID=A0A8X7ZD17_POPTO|nr:hypothetical protein POTOM_024871 [Populus tomentosa]
MPVSRDRLSSPVDIAAIFAARRQSRILGVYQDQPELDMALVGSPRPNAATRTQTVGVVTITVRGRGGLGTPRGRGGRTPLGRENIPPSGSARRGRGRGSNSVLPAWYPRTPLRDVTAVVRSLQSEVKCVCVGLYSPCHCEGMDCSQVCFLGGNVAEIEFMVFGFAYFPVQLMLGKFFDQAIERRRERLGGSDGLEIRSPMPQVRMNHDSSEATPDAHLEHSNRIMSPKPTTAVKDCSSTIGKVPKILQHITNQASGDPDSLTPQKKLLDSIDTVEKAVMEELRKMKRTPSARRAEREKRVRTLMSMR